MSASTFKNRIPKRKYRERAQPANRQRFGLLEKKKDYKERAKNYHQKEDRLKKFQLKAQLRNEDEFYFKMLKAKKNEDGKHIQQQSDDDSDMDEKEFRASVKTENYNIVNLQRSIAKNKIDKLKGQLHMTSGTTPKTHNFFIDEQQDINNVSMEWKFRTLPELIQENMLDVCPKSLDKDIEIVADSGTVKAKYQKLANYIQKEQKLSKIMMKIAYQKNLLTKERKIIKKHGKVKYHKFFIERRK